jgi:hypothetical protein
MNRSSTGSKLGSKGGGSTGGRDEGRRTGRWAAVQQGRLWPRASASRQQCRARRASGVWVVRQRQQHEGQEAEYRRSSGQRRFGGWADGHRWGAMPGALHDAGELPMSSGMDALARE